MSPKKALFRLSCISLLIVSLAMLTFADTIRLKDGGIIKGKIISFTNGRFTIVIGAGSRTKQLTFAAGEVASIDFDSPSDAPRLTVSDRSRPEDTRMVKTGSTASPKVIMTETTGQKIELPTVVVGGNRQTKSPPAARTTTASNDAAPISWSVKVLADNTANGWTNSGWVLRKGQRIRITGDGQVSLGRGNKTSPSGLSDLEDEQKLLKNVPTGALIAVIGDDNNDFIYVGAEREFTASRDGALFLGINEGYLDDNKGSFEVKVEILPDGN